LELNRLFDVYHEYDGLNNLYTVNAAAGQKAVAVDPRVIELLNFYLSQDHLAPGTINVALGPVIEIWRRYRDQALSGGPARVPPISELRQADTLCDPSQIQIDASNNTIYLAKAGMRLDVGAVAKGFATRLVANELAGQGLLSGIISAGGSNVCLIGKPLDNRKTWQIGIQNPFGNPLIPDDPPLDSILANDVAIATSGDYQRYYEVDGQIYHHLIDTATLMPARYFRAVTILTKDSALADFLSTAVFLLPYNEGRKLVESLPDCQALWVFPDGRLEMTPGMRDVLKNKGAAVTPSAS
jgi:thiamine biosynthesis lipoprotein